MPEKHDRIMKDSMSIVGKGDQHTTDDRGHLIGHQFYGSDRLENLVPQEGVINKGSYANLENYLADLVLNEKKEVYVSVTPFYKGTRRPEAIFYYYSVDGHSSAVFFTNSLPEESK